MIIDIKKKVVENIFKSNRLIDLSIDSVAKSLAGIYLLRENESQIVSLKNIFPFVLKKICQLSKYKVLLFIGTEIAQPNTKIIRYYKLKGLLEKRNVVIPNPGKWLECEVETKEGVFFFGATEIDEPSISLAINILAIEACTYLVALPIEIPIEQILKIGWSGRFEKDLEFLKHIDKSNGIVFKAVGNFDDRERGLIGIANIRFIKCLFDDSSNKM